MWILAVFWFIMDIQMAIEGRYMAAIPYGYRMKDRKLEADPAEAAVVKYIFEAKQRYTEQPPIWGEAVIDGKYQLWKERQEEVSELTMPEFMKE